MTNVIFLFWGNGSGGREQNGTRIRFGCDMVILSGGGCFYTGQYSVCGGGTYGGYLCVRCMSGAVGADEDRHDGGVSCPFLSVPVASGVCASCAVYADGRVDAFCQ